MTVVRDIQFKLDFDEFMNMEGSAFRRADVQDMVRWAIDEAQELICPALVYEWLPVERVGGRYVAIGGLRFDLGDHAFLMDAALKACVAVATIGGRLEQRVTQLMTSGDAFRGYLLDEVGVFALATTTGRCLREIAQKEGARRGWGVGAELGPGQLTGWDVAEQRIICDLVDIDSIGVGVTEGGMLVPQKSNSAVVGIGPGFTADEVHPPCDFCHRQKTCTWAH